jgi:hypothetical protein
MQKKKRREKASKAASDHQQVDRRVWAQRGRHASCSASATTLMRAGTRKPVPGLAGRTPWPCPRKRRRQASAARVLKRDYSSTPCRALMAGLRVASPRGVSGSPGSAQDTPLARSCARRRVSALAELGTLPAMLSLPFVNWEYLCCQLGMMVSYNT